VVGIQSSKKQASDPDAIEATEVRAVWLIVTSLTDWLPEFVRNTYHDSAMKWNWLAGSGGTACIINSSTCECSRDGLEPEATTTN
jgi:Mg/Co/Ni transporter MgtE